MDTIPQSRKYSRQLSTAIIMFALTVLVTANILCVRHFIISIPIGLMRPRKALDNPIIACHRSRHDDALPLLNEGNMAANTKHLFFHETSCKGRLNSRQSCSIESAAMNNADWTVNVLFSGPLSASALKSANIAKLMSMPNVKFQRIHIDEYAKGTALESFFSRNLLSNSLFPAEHASDVLRLLTLHKYGGLYIDMDMVVVRSFHSLPKHFSPKELNSFLGSAVLAWTKEGIGKNISDLAIREIQNDYKPYLWTYNGPALIQRVLNKVCSTSNVTLMNNSTCKGFHVLDPIYFFPIHYMQLGRLFSEIKSLQLGEEYMYHIWNSMSGKNNLTRNSMYAKLAQKFCPATYKLYGDKFGT